MQHAATPLVVLALIGGASAYSAGPLASASPSGVLAEDAAMLAVPAEGAEVSEDLGAPYAATEPLLGVRVPFVPATSPKRQLPRAACAPLAAAIARHTFWFKGAGEMPANITEPQTTVLPGSSNQQDGQRNFLRKISTSLCARGHEQTDDEYTTILHSMLDEVRTHINRHVHSAFWVKATCSEIDLCYENRGNVPGQPEDALTNSTISYLLPEVNLCLDTVLEHEKYNLAEGFTFVDIQYTLLSRGAAFCTDPKRDVILSRWNTTLEDAMAYHAGNHAFDDMLDAHFAQLCTEPDEYEGQYDEIFAAVADQIDADVYAEQSCSFHPNAFDRMPFLSENPPAAVDAINTIEMNTWLTIQSAASVVRGVLTNSSCVSSETQKGDAQSTAAILSDFEALMAAQASKLQSLGLDWGTIATAQSDYLSLPTVYHKLMMMCVATPETPFGDNMTNICMIDGKLKQGFGVHGIATATSDYNPTFDLIPAADISQCNGEACKNAAKAVLAYQELLGVVTVLRYDLIRATTGTQPAQERTYTWEEWVWQRSCPAMRSIVDKAAILASALPTVVDGLRAAAPQLQTSCVGSMRNKTSPMRATVILGEEKAMSNLALWERADGMAAMCNEGP